MAEPSASWAPGKPFTAISQVLIHKGVWKPCSPLLGLPLDLLYSIFDFLPLSAKIIFSQACKDLRYFCQARCSMAIQNASMGERLECLEVLAKLLLRFRICFKCQSLHDDDRPSESVSQMFNISLDSPPCPTMELSWRRHLVFGSCPVAFRHAQTALGYTKLIGEHQKYLPKLFPNFEIRSDNFGCMKLRWSIQSQIYQGKLLLKTLWELSGINNERLSAETIHTTPFYICPHLCCGSPGSPPSDALKSSLVEMFNRIDNGKNEYYFGPRGSCVACPTDFALCALGSGARMTITVFQDLGTSQSADDPFWASHIVDECNNTSRYNTFVYQHGYVRELWGLDPH